jgi:formylglycine-generating enzyme required for sulfatase activity
VTTRAFFAALAFVACSRTTTEAKGTPPDAAAPQAALAKPPPGMVLIPAGTFTMGTDRGATFEGPAHAASVRAFFLDAFEVTTEAFAKFASEASYVTTAEKVGESSVFDPKSHAWAVVKHADWKHPDGTKTAARAKDPVVHVAWSDADAYCRWSGGRLPTEIEWERAARGGLESARFPWGDDDVVPEDGGRPRANVWQGRFPDRDDGADGFRGIAPVGSFPPNAFGLFDMAGNVWEWTDTFFDAASAGDPAARERVIRGGSWLCSASHCVGYRTAARGKAVAGEGTNHVGFRCARTAEPAQMGAAL